MGTEESKEEESKANETKESKEEEEASKTKESNEEESKTEKGKEEESKTKDAEESASGIWPWSAKPQRKPRIVQYGPQDCISTYKNDKGECVMQTKCAGVDTSDYEFGLLCVDKKGVPV